MWLAAQCPTQWGIPPAVYEFRYFPNACTPLGDVALSSPSLAPFRNAAKLLRWIHYGAGENWGVMLLCATITSALKILPGKGHTLCVYMWLEPPCTKPYVSRSFILDLCSHKGGVMQESACVTQSVDINLWQRHDQMHQQVASVSISF